MDDKCNILKADGSRCQMPAGFGVEGSLGNGPCFHHVEAEVLAGDAVLTTTKGHASTLEPRKQKEVFRYEMEGDSRLATILRGMGAEMVVDRGRKGVSTLDLDFELKAMRAMLVVFMERYEEREEALLTWAQAYAQGDAGPPPRNVLSIEMGHKAVVGIANVAKTMHDIQGSVPKSEFMQLLVDMADVVVANVKDKKAVKAIKRQWLQLCGKYMT